MRIESLPQWLAAHPPDDGAFVQSLAGVADRVIAGEDLRVGVRELLDELKLLPRRDLLARAIADRPAPTGSPRADAYLAALAEHIAAREGLERPGWSIEPDRFLERFWFVSEVPGFRAIAVVQSPAAFRRRGIFIARDALVRV
ncbi:MAG: hypothetical protein Q8O56_02135 [Solirubrobacteraceae bacterium]|nr:hypothetical protein [Solirubrobacteraceae bacterium]